MLQVRLQNITQWRWILFCGIYIAIIHSRFLSLLLDFITLLPLNCWIRYWTQARIQEFLTGGVPKRFFQFSNSKFFAKFFNFFTHFYRKIFNYLHNFIDCWFEPFIYIQNQLTFSIKITVPTTYNIVCFKFLLKHIKRIHNQKTQRWTENDSDQISCMPRSWFRIYWWRILSAEWSPSTRWRLASKVRFVLWQTIQYIKIKTKRIQMLLSITRWTATFRRYLRNRIRSRSI